MSLYQRFLPYGVALASTALAVELSLWLEPLILRTIGAFFYMAIAFSAWYGGLRPGMVATVLALAAINYFFMPPRNQFVIQDANDIFRSILFALVALIITLLSANLKQSRCQVEQLSRQLIDESSDRLKTALNAAQMGMWDWDLVTGAITWSPEHEQLFGLPPGAFDGRYETFDERLHPHDREGLNQAVAHALHHQVPYQHEYRVVWTDGSVHWVEGRGHAFYDDARQPVRMTGTIIAIDQRKQAETALQERESLLELFAQYAPAGIAMFDREMRYVMASQRWVDEYQLDSIDSLLGRSHYDIFPEIPERWRQIHQRCLAGAIEKGEDDLFVRADGTEQWLSWEVHPWYQAGGAVGGIIIFSVDVTARKQAEAELRHSEARLHLAQTASNCGVWDWDLQTNTLFWSPEYYQLYGLDATVEASYENWLRCIHPDDQDYATQTTLNAIENPDTELNVQFRVLRSGEVRWFAGIAQVFCNAAKEPLRMIGITIDITQQKQTEIALQKLNTELEQRVIDRTAELTALNDRLSQSEEKFRQLAENIQAVFWILDTMNRQVLYVSPAYEAIWGRSRTLLYQNFDEWIDAVHPDDRLRVWQTFQENVAQGYFDHEYRVIQPDGSIRWIRDRAFPVKDETGRVIRTAGIAEDITERQKIEEIKSEFIGIVSHELRTPLTAIQMSLGLARTGIYASKPEKLQRMIEIAYLDTHRLVNLVNDILDLERLESGRAALEKTACRADDLIQQAVNSVQAIASQQHITFTFSPSDVKVWAAADAIVQTLTNLLSNAIKFSPEGSVIDLRAERQAAQVLFQVKDQGRGIPAGKLEAVFERFQQVDVSDSREKGGTGLGLPICRSIIERHGGKIWAESTLGAGSTFFFTLPVSPEDSI